MIKGADSFLLQTLRFFGVHHGTLMRSCSGDGAGSQEDDDSSSSSLMETMSHLMHGTLRASSFNDRLIHPWCVVCGVSFLLLSVSTTKPAPGRPNTNQNLDQFF